GRRENHQLERDDEERRPGDQRLAAHDQGRPLPDGPDGECQRRRGARNPAGQRPRRDRRRCRACRLQPALVERRRERRRAWYAPQEYASYSCASDATMITKRSVHIPTLITIDSANSAVVFLRARRLKNASGATELQTSVSQNSPA